MLLNPLHYVLARDLDPAAASSVSGPRFRSGLGSSSSSSCSASWSFFFFLAFFFFLSFFFFFFSSSVPEEEVEASVQAAARQQTCFLGPSLGPAAPPSASPAWQCWPGHPACGQCSPSASEPPLNVGPQPPAESSGSS